MADVPRGSPGTRLSDALQQMAQRLLRRPDGTPSAEAARMALFLANIAWNEAIGITHDRDESRAVWGVIENDRPDLWDEFQSIDIEAMIDSLVEYKRQHYPDDRRRILTCGIPDGRNVRVEWVPPATDGVDSQWEMQLFALLRLGEREQAARFLQSTRSLNPADAEQFLDAFASRYRVDWRD